MNVNVSKIWTSKTGQTVAPKYIPVKHNILGLPKRKIKVINYNKTYKIYISAIIA